jgi:N-acetylmuramoyl-L-alanine amidase
MSPGPLKGLAFAPNAQDIDILARTLYGEARGEGLVGMQAVAWVVVNRCKATTVTPRRQFGTGSVASACKAKAQFSCWNESDPNFVLVRTVSLDAPDFQRAMYAALSVVIGEFPDPTAGARFYWAASIDTPEWAEGQSYVSIGRHRFLQGDA